MKSEEALITKGLKHLWYPCSQMKDYEDFQPLVVTGAQGSYIELANGKRIIDAISSWWCKSLGHNHPAVKQALLRQVEQFEHVILANTTNATIVNLSAVLARLSPSLSKVFYAGDGSSAVEIALKMSLHARQMTGEPKRTKFIALSNAYHGETTGALSVSDVGIYRRPYRAMLFNVHFISPIPYVVSTRDPLWLDCSSYWKTIEEQLAPLAETATAIIVEPIVQGAGGMKIYSQDLLKRLRSWSKQHKVHLIADEIMTGLGRTGTMLACEHADIEADFICLSKGLTSGWLPFSAVLTTDAIYALFYDDYATGKAFLHSHTYSGNVLAASVALAVINIIAGEKLYQRANDLEGLMLNALYEIKDETKKINNIRGIGAIVAADLMAADVNQRLGYKVFQKAAELGALLRPLGNTLYWLPPLNIQVETISELKKITRNAILAAGV